MVCIGTSSDVYHLLKVHTDWVIMYLNRYRFRQEKFSVQVYKPLAGSKEGMEGKNWLYLFHCA